MAAEAIGKQQAAHQQGAQEPALFVSAKQLAALTDPDDPDGEHGRYLPVRKTTKGLFTQALYTAPQPAAQQGAAYAALPDERATFEAQFPVPGGVHGDGTEYVVKDSHVTAYRCHRFWEAWKARASQGQAPATAKGDIDE